MASTVCRAATAVSSERQSSGPRKSEISVTSPAVVRDAATVRRARPSRSRRRLPRARRRGWPGAGRHPVAAAGRRGDAFAAGPEGHDPEAIAASGDEASDDERGTLGNVGLAPVRGPEVHRRGGVEDEPGRELAVRHVLAELRDAGAGGRVPVDAADVIARFVRPDAVEVQPLPEAAAPVVAGHPAADAPAERELEPPDQVVGDGAGTRSGRGPLAPGGSSEVGHAVGSIARSSCGAGTSLMTRWMTVSAVTPSVRAA